MEEFNIKLTKKDLNIVSEALSKMPYGLVVQIFNKFQEQISSQLKVEDSE